MTPRPNGATTWDLLVVGGGTAGIVAATTAAGLGASVLLVERHRTGGDCLWTGCVPSKALIAAATAARDAARAGALGAHAGPVTVDFAQVMDHVGSAIAAAEPPDSPAALERSGVRLATAGARFTGPDTALVGDEPVRFRQAVIATGSHPVMPPIRGLGDVQPLTTDSVWSVTELPRRLLVIGGGSIGCELGQAFSRLGSQVTLVEAAPGLLAREDRSAATLVEQALADDGVDVRIGARVIALRPDASSTPPATVADLADGSALGFDQVLVAVGRTPSSDGLGLADAAVAVDMHGNVRVDEHLRTTNRRIWAAGDVTGHPQFTHLAGVHGSLAATNAVLGLRRRVGLAAVPRVTFTSPEVAAVGVPTGPGRPAGVIARTVRHSRVDRAITDGRTDGLTRLAVDRRGRLLGATVVGPRAGETIGELALAVRLGLKARDLAATIHPYPTYSDAPWTAAIADGRARLARPAAARSIAALAALRRRWLDVRTSRGRG